MKSVLSPHTDAKIDFEKFVKEVYDYKVIYAKFEFAFKASEKVAIG